MVLMRIEYNNLLHSVYFFISMYKILAFFMELITNSIFNVGIIIATNYLSLLRVVGTAFPKYATNNPECLRRLGFLISHNPPECGFRHYYLPFHSSFSKYLSGSINQSSLRNPFSCNPPSTCRIGRIHMHHPR